MWWLLRERCLAAHAGQSALWQGGLGVRESKKSPCVGLGSWSIFTSQQACADPVSYSVLAPRALAAHGPTSTCWSPGAELRRLLCGRPRGVQRRETEAQSGTLQGGL